METAQSYILAGNSPNKPSTRLKYLNQSVFYGSDQKTQKQKEEVEGLLNAYNKRWKIRNYKINEDKVTAILHESGGSWVVSVPYTIDHSDGLFRLTASRIARFSVMGINHKPLIVAYKTSLPKDHDDQFTPIRETIIPNLKQFNNNRLAAARKTVAMEASYYAKEVYYYGDTKLTHDQIVAKIRESRTKNRARAHRAIAYSDFIHLNNLDSTGQTFKFKCTTEVTTDEGKKIHTEDITVKYLAGKPYVISIQKKF